MAGTTRDEQANKRPRKKPATGPKSGYTADEWARLSARDKAAIPEKKQDRAKRETKKLVIEKNPHTKKRRTDYYDKISKAKGR